MADEALAERHVREFARACVRSGLLTEDAVRAEVRQAVAAELPARAGEAGRLAAAWVDQARAQLAGEQDGWDRPTDYDRLQDAFAALVRELDVVVLQGVEDHWTAKAELDRRAAEGRSPRGVAWFTAPDVWHAVDEGMLEVNLWHGSTANAAPGDALLDDVLAVLARHGLTAHFDEGRIEVAARWQRRLDQ